MTINELDLDFEEMNVHCWEGGSGFPVVMMHGSGPGASTMGNWRNWVSTSLSYPLHLVSEAAMTAD